MGVYPLGIDAGYLDQYLTQASVRSREALLRTRFAGKRLIVGFDPVDPFGGIPHKLYAFEAFLKRYPDYVGCVVYVQLATPRAQDEPTKALIHTLAARINGRFGRFDYMPLMYLDRHASLADRCALYAAADVLAVCSLSSVPSFSPLEFVVCQSERNAELAQNGPGALILSESANANTLSALGAGAVVVNPWNTPELAEAFALTLALPREERQRRHRLLAAHVRTHTAAAWAGCLLRDGLARFRERVRGTAGETSGAVRDSGTPADRLSSDEG